MTIYFKLYYEIRKSVAQYGTDFWGNDAADNYGFGSSEIEGRIGQVTDRLDNGRMDNQQNISSDGSPAWDNVKNFTQIISRLKEKHDVSGQIKIFEKLPSY